MAYKMYVSSGEKIRKARMERGMSETDFAKELGCSEEHVRLIEGCDRKISPDMTKRLCRYIGCRPEEILCMEEGILEQAGTGPRGKKPQVKKPPAEQQALEGKGGERPRILADAKRITEARKAAGLTQKDLADMLGVSAGTVSAIEHGTSDIPPEAVEKLGRCLSMPAGYFQGDPSLLDISIKTHNSCLLQRLASAAIECEDSPDSVDLAARMLIRESRKADAGKIVT